MSYSFYQQAMNDPNFGQPSKFVSFDEMMNQTSLYSLQASTYELAEREVIYYFDVIKSHKVQLQSQITDYWLEDSTAVQDSINIQPIIITLSGLVGEVVFKPPHTLMGKIIDKLNKFSPTNSVLGYASKLKPLQSLFASVDNVTQMAKNAVSYMDEAWQQYSAICKQFQKNSQNNIIPRQEYIYQQFEWFWKNKTPLMVNTPYGLFDDMYIQNVIMEQGETNTVSEISVTLKKLSFKEVIPTKANREDVDKYNAMAKAKEENLGPSKNGSAAFEYLAEQYPSIRNLPQGK